MNRIAIVGGHGKVALLLIPRLAAAHHDVRALVRNPDHAADISALGAQPSVCDIEHADTDAIVAVLEGCDAVVWSAGAGGGSSERTYAVDRDAAIRTMDAAVRADVKRFVMVSYIGAGIDHVEPDNGFYAYAQAKAAADAYLRTTSLRWTILGPGTLTSDDASGRIDLVEGPSSAGDKTSRANVAWAIASVLKGDTAVGKTLRFIDGDTPIEASLGQ
ncbi:MULTISPECIES: SDR family oxidoreductase [unclassified Luteibacter]|uniref:SDR family oxidoreductase n=1 Tax=Luteibacter sp. PvP019 TaxID=3156436 RepID=UPI00339718FF